MERMERGFFGKLLVFVLTILAIIGLVAMALSVVCPHINPKHMWQFSFFGLAFWEIFLFNVLVFFALLLLWSRKAWISVLALVIAIPGINKSYAFGNRIENEDGIRVMSYNVHMFQPIDKKDGSEEYAIQIINLIREQSPDLLCCQEFSTFNRKIARNKCIEMFSDSIGLPYYYFNTRRNYSGNVIFSKYPIKKVTEGTGFSKEETYGILVDVDAGEKGSFYLANIHLASFMLTDNELEVLTNTTEHQQALDTIGKSVVHKLKYAFANRSNEVKEMLQGLSEKDIPILLCGDFNDTPLSYTYRRIQKAGFKDAFIAVGKGIKPTYAGKLPLLRIDYMWVNDRVIPIRYNRLSQKLSDHYPITLEFKLSNQ